MENDQIVCKAINYMLRTAFGSTVSEDIPPTRTVGEPPAGPDLMPPVVVDPGAGGVQRVVTFMHSLAGVAAGVVADGEARRLSTYFDALQQRIRRILPQKPSLQGEGYNPLKYVRNIITYHRVKEDFAQGAGIADQFRAVADATKSVITSEVGIIPKSVYGQFLYKMVDDTPKYMDFFKDTLLAGYSQNLGFYQVFRQNGSGSTTFPVLVLDDDVIGRVAAHAPPDLLNSLQNIATIANHDMMHHLTNVDLTGRISKIERGVAYKDTMVKMLRPRTRSYSDDDHSSYESWNILSHTKTWRELRSRGIDMDMDKNVRSYFSGLEEMNDKAGKCDDPEESTRIRKIVGHLGMVGMFSMMRVLPLDDPLMNHALDTMERINSDPGFVSFIAGNYEARNILAGLMGPADDALLRRAYKEIVAEEDFPSFIGGHILEAHCVLSAVRVAHEYFCEEKARTTGHPNGLPSPLSEMPQNFTDSDRGLQQQDIARYCRVVADIDYAAELQPGIRSNSKDQEENVALAIANLRQRELMFMIVSKYANDKNKDYDVDLVTRISCATFRAQIKPHNADQIDKNIIGYIHLSDSEKIARTFRNYEDAGRKLHGDGHNLPTYRELKLFELACALPVMAYLGSPPGSDPLLKAVHENADLIDRDVVRILGRYAAKPSQPQ